MRRREFMAGLAAEITLPLAARAQTADVRRLGVIHQGGPLEASIEGLREGLRAAGLEGRHIALLIRNTKGDLAAAETVARALELDDKVDLIVAINTNVALAAKRGTERVPIVFAAGVDPVAAGLIDNLAAPGGRLTGFQFLSGDLTAKRLEILHEIVPKLRRVVTFYDPRNPSANVALAAAREAGRKLGIEIAGQQVTSPEEMSDRLNTLAATNAEAIFFVPGSPIPTTRAALIIETANKMRLPTMVQDLGLVRAGGLAGYGTSYREYGRRSAGYVARILAGTPPGDLPVEAVQQPILAINLQTARTLGLDIPPLLLTRADEVIE
jgi:putative ABC transport system substrate-binding protein